MSLANKTENDCTICHNEIYHRTMMTCKATHSFCFKCILEYVEKNTELKSCPNCRGGNKFIIIPIESNEESNVEVTTSDISVTTNNKKISPKFDFYSLDTFKGSLPILQKIKKLDSDNSCLVSESTLLLYINNKEPLCLASRILKSKEFNYEIEDLVKIFKWKTKGPGNGSIGFSLGTQPEPNSSTINQIVGNFLANELSGLLQESENEDQGHVTNRNYDGRLDEIFYSFPTRRL